MSVNNENSKLSVLSTMVAMILGFSGLFAFAVVFWGVAGVVYPDFLATMGSFLVGRIGWAAFLVPVYLFAATLVLLKPGYRVEYLYYLGASILPCAILVFLGAFIQDPETLYAPFPSLEAIGTIPISLVIAALALAVSIIVYQLKDVFFPAGAGRGSRIAGLISEKGPEPEEPVPVFFGRTQAQSELQTEAETKPLDKLEEEELPTNELSDPASLSEFWAENQAHSPLAQTKIIEESVPPAPHRPPKRPLAAAYFVPTDILNVYPDGQYWIIDDKTRSNAVVLKETLAEFKIEAEVTGIRKGPVVTMFEILPAPGVKLSKIVNLADNIALRLAASTVRIVAPIPGKHAVGIEVPNEKRNIVSFKEIVESDAFQTTKVEIPVVLGKDIAGEAQVIDLTQTPHLLIAGATGSGKSVSVNSIILSVLYKRSPNEVRLILIDPKIVELKLYNDIPHLLTPVITEPRKAFQALQYCLCEMERRYSMLDRLGVRDIKSFNRKIGEKKLAQERMPFIVVVIDEFADLMATTGKELESTLARLAAMSRAVGIHLVLATQRPSIDVITGLIKANIPSRIAFMVAGKFDSRIIIDAVGAEKLLGRGDMLFSSAWDPFPIRMQGAYVSEEEVERVVEMVKTLGEPDYIDDEIFIDDDEEEGEPSLFDEEADDPLYEKALEIVLQQGRASASFIQRRLKIGYNRAARLVELMEEKGIVGPSQGSKPRDVLRNPDIHGLRHASQPALIDDPADAAD